MRVLAGLARGEQAVLPKDGFLEVPIVEVRKGNVEKFWQELKKLNAGDEGRDGAERERSTLNVQRSTLNVQS